MPQGQFYPSQILDEATRIYENLVTVKALRAGGPAPTVTAGTGAGTGGAISQQTGSDMAGSFLVTTGTGPGAGTMASIVFGTPLGSKPDSVAISAADETAGAATSLAAGAAFISASGFTVHTGAAGGANKLIRVCYFVIQ